MMKKLYCPKHDDVFWANEGKDKKDPTYRCTKCGEIHTKGGSK